MYASVTCSARISPELKFMPALLDIPQWFIPLSLSRVQIATPSCRLRKSQSSRPRELGIGADQKSSRSARYY